MTDIKTGLWQNTLDGSFIKVRRSGKIGVYYNDEGCKIEHVMSMKEFSNCYRLVEADKPALVGKSTSTRLEKIIQAAIEIRTELNLIEDSTGGGEIQWAEAMTEPVNKLVVALNHYQLGDTFNNDNPRVWININDDSCIKVSHIGSQYAYYSEEGSSDSHSMDIKYFTENYGLAGIGEKLAPVIDDTFNDDTPAQTFSVLENMAKIICLKCGLDYQLYHNRLSIERDGMCRQCFDKANAGKTIPFYSCDFGTDEKCVKIAVCLTCDAKMPEGSEAFEAVNQGLGCMNCNSNAGKMHLIGIAGPARAGKDTLCSYMLDNLDGTWLRSSFADPIKEMLRAIGVDCSDEAKEVVSDDYGVTPRHMMQTLGTEWGRNLIDGDIWVKAFARLNAGKCVIVPDVRFENEAELVRANGVLIHLVGRGGIEGNHVSENAIEFKPGDIVIDNSRDLAWLHGQVDGNAVLSEFIAEISE